MLLLAGVIAQKPAAPKAPPPPDGNKLVQVGLIAERSSIEPGERFLVATKLVVSPKWHIYWGENPGDTGLPTAVEVKTPEGFGQSPPRFPVPTRHLDAGDIVSFQLEGEVYVLTECVAPKDLQPGAAVEISVDADWLACIEQCYPGHGTASLKLPVVAVGTAVESRRAHAAEFAAALAKQPKPISERKGLSLELVPDPKLEGVTLRIQAPRAKLLDFFPRTEENPRWESFEVDAQDPSRATLRYRWAEKPDEDTSLALFGILTLQGEQGPEHYRIEPRYSEGW